MKISRINQIAAGTLLLVVVALASAMLWSLRQLDNSFTASHDYQQLQEQINTSVTRPVLIYLGSGDATLLTAIDQALNNLINEDPRVSKLTDGNRRALSNKLSELQSVALYNLREAGKLKKPQELLINNEREMLAAASQLRDYTDSGTSYLPDLKQRYNDTLNKLVGMIPVLAHSRESYFSVSPRNNTNIELQLTALEKIGGKLEQLPRLGIYMKQKPMDCNPCWAIQRTKALSNPKTRSAT